MLSLSHPYSPNWLGSCPRAQPRCVLCGSLLFFFQLETQGKGAVPFKPLSVCCVPSHADSLDLMDYMCLKASPSLSSPKYWVLPPKILETSECLLHVTKLLFPGMISRASSSASQKPSQLKLWRTSGSGIITSTSNTWEYCLGFGAHGDPEASHFVFEAPSYL